MELLVKLINYVQMANVEIRPKQSKLLCIGGSFFIVFILDFFFHPIKPIVTHNKTKHYRKTQYNINNFINYKLLICIHTALYDIHIPTVVNCLNKV